MPYYLLGVKKRLRNGGNNGCCAESIEVDDANVPIMNQMIHSLGLGRLVHIPTTEGLVETELMQLDKSYRVGIVEDHPLMRMSIRMLVESIPEVQICGEATSAQDMIMLLESTRLDLLILDIGLPGGSGINLARHLKKTGSKTRVLVYTMFDEKTHALQALEAGASGYVMKSHDPQELVQAVQKIMRNEIHFSREVELQSLSRLNAGRRNQQSSISPVDLLSRRELEIYEWVGHGYRNAEIAEKLKLSVKTVDLYRSRVIKKLCVRGSAELTRSALLWVSSQSIPT